MDMIGRIRRLHGRGKKSEREIARMTALSRNTVAKWLHGGPVLDAPKYEGAAQSGKLTAYHETIKLALVAWERSNQAGAAPDVAGGRQDVHKFLKNLCMS